MLKSIKMRFLFIEAQSLFKNNNHIAVTNTPDLKLRSSSTTISQWGKHKTACCTLELFHAQL